MESKKINKSKEDSNPRKSASKELLTLIDTNQVLFKQIKDQLMGQLVAYETAFSRDHNKYIEQRDFDHFKQFSDKFKRKGKGFVDNLVEIKANCLKVIKFLPQQQKLILSENINGFDMFVNQQVQRAVEYKMKTIQYEDQVNQPFQNPISLNTFSMKFLEEI